MNSNDQRTNMLRRGRIPKTLMTLAIPSIIGMVANGVYNIVDTVFVGRINTEAIGAVSVVFPFFMLIAAAGIAIGMGAGSYISRCLGAQDEQEAERTLVSAVALVVTTGVLLMVLGLAWLEPLLRVFGATDTILPYALVYGRILVLGSPIVLLKMTLNGLLRAEGSARASMKALLLGACLNMALDPLFIFSFGMGISGAAVATVVSQATAVVYQLWYYASRRSLLQLTVRRLQFSKPVLVQILKIGMPLFLTQGLNSVAMALINTAAAPYGDAAVAAMGIVKRVMSLGMFAVFGYAQGFQPVAGFNYGAGLYDRLREAIRFSLAITSVFTVALSLLLIGFSNQVISWFSVDPQVLTIGSRALIAVSVPFPLLGFQLVYFSLFQAMGKAVPAAVLALSRQGLLLIPAVLVLPLYWGLDGVIFAQPLADVLTIVLTVVLGVAINRQIGRLRTVQKEKGKAVGSVYGLGSLKEAD